MIGSAQIRITCNGNVTILYPVINDVTTKTSATFAVNLFNPDSALFCEEKIFAIPPIAPNPSPFGEWIKTKIMSNTAAIICNIQINVSILNSVNCIYVIILS